MLPSSQNFDLLFRWDKIPSILSLNKLNIWKFLKKVAHVISLKFNSKFKSKTKANRINFVSLYYKIQIDNMIKVENNAKL